MQMERVTEAPGAAATETPEPYYGIVGSNVNGTFTFTTDVIVFMSVDAFLIVATLAGNALTICAIRFSRKLSAFLSNWFIFSLALSDLMVGLTVPYHLAFAVEAALGDMAGTCVLRFVLTILACSSSIMNLLVIATDRYIAIVYPLHYCRYMTKTLAVCLVSVSWMCCFAVATMPIYWHTWTEEGACTIDEVLPATYFNFLLTPLFVSIWVSMLLLYLRIWREASENARRLKKSAGVGQGAKGSGGVHGGSSGTNISESRSVQVVMLILGCFSFCWLPYFGIITYNRMNNEHTSSHVYEAAFTLAVSNSCMNPLIYAWKNSNFREAFRCMLRCRSPRTLSQQAPYITDHEPPQLSRCYRASNDEYADATSLELNGSASIKGGVSCVTMDLERCSDVTTTTSMHSSHHVDP